MPIRRLLTLALLSLTLSAHAADGQYFKLTDLMDSESVKDFQDPAIKLYWGSEPASGFAEVARPDVYTRSSISLSPFGGSARHCVEAFERVLKATIDDARARGYDAITNLRFVRDGKPSDDVAGFRCKPGYKTTEVSLQSSFAMTPAAADQLARTEAASATAPARPAASGAIYLPLEPILTSPEAAAILGATVSAHWGLANPPAYSERYGPEEYSDEADPRKLGSEAACTKAVLNVLGAMVQDARERHFDTLLKIRSALNGEFAPVPTDVECQLGKKSASVTLRASLASRKPARIAAAP